MYITLTAMALLLVALFGVWWFEPTKIPNNFSGVAHIFDVLLFLIITYVIWHPIIMRVLSWAIASNIKDVRTQKPQPELRVAFVTTFVPGTESLDLLKKTLPAMMRAHYEHDTWLLDEGNDPEARKLCGQLGVKYFSRYGKAQYNTADGKFATKTKGGNHNSWYDTIGNNYDVVAQLDTDFIPKKDFLVKTLGYFKDPKVAFVGTPQVYGNTKTSFIARGAAEQTYSFYGPMLRGLYGMDTTLLIGANHIIRVAALKDVDHYSAHITEDLLTGMKLHARGWKSVYVHEVLAVGEGPSTWQAFFSQQMRWAYGCIDILFRYTPKLLRTMNWRQRTYYFFIQQHYFTGLVQGLSTIGLLMYFLFGLTFVNVPLAQFLERYLTVVLAMSIVSLWMQRFNVRPREERGLLLAGSVVNIAAWPIFLLALFGAVRGKRLTYKVTPKGHNTVGKSGHHEPIRLFLPHLIIGGLDLSLLATSLVTHRHAPIMIFWATVTTIFMLALPFATIAAKAAYATYAQAKASITSVAGYYWLRTLGRRMPADSPVRIEE
jgi:cellulose synthase (UDP-forming)